MVVGSIRGQMLPTVLYPLPTSLPLFDSLTLRLSKKITIRCSFFSFFYVIISVRQQDSFEALLHRYRGQEKTMNTILTDEQAAQYTMDYVLGEWATEAKNKIQQFSFNQNYQQ